MSFNALSVAKIGLGFGALAVASIGLLSPATVEIPVTPPQTTFSAAAPRVKGAIIVVRAAGQTRETEQIHAQAGIIVNATAGTTETERNQACATLVIQSAASIQHPAETTRATARFGLDWQHIAKLDDEALAAGLI
jgi:hypothetical protein